MTQPVNNQLGTVGNGSPTPPGNAPEAALMAVAPVKKPASRRFAIASVIVGALAALGYLVLVGIILTAIAGVNESTRGSGNPLQVVGTGFALGYWFSLYILPFALLFFCGNCLGFILSAVALCRANGRELGFGGLLLNTMPVVMFFGFLGTILPAH